MKEKEKDKLFGNLPNCAAEFIKLVIKKMRYRKKVRAEVMAELSAHFEDELKECTNDEEKDKKAQRLIEDFGDVKLLAVLLRRAKKRCRPLWRTVVARTFQTISVLILCLIVYLVWFLSGKPVVTVDYVAELNRIVRPATDESLNAAPLYNKAVELYEEKSSDEMPELLGTKYNEATAEQKQVIEEWLSDNEEIFDLVIAGTKKPYYWHNYESKTGEVIAILMPHLAEFRRLAYALRWRAQLRAEQGRYEDAFEDIKSCYRLGQHIKGDVVLVEQLVGMAIEDIAVRTLRSILSNYEIGSSKLAALQKDFEGIIAAEDFVVSLKAEKLTMYDEIQRCFTEDHLGGGHLYPPRIVNLGGDAYQVDKLIVEVILSPERWPGGIHAMFFHPNKKHTKQMVDRYYDYWEKIAHKSPAQIRAEGIDTEKETMEIIKGNLLLQILAPALGRVSEIRFQRKTLHEATVTILALQRWQLEKGQYPADLDELVTAGYLNELPMDPYSNKPLVYKRTDDDFILYSVGYDFEDDGGEVYRDDKGRVRPWADEGDAVFWPVRK